MVSVATYIAPFTTGLTMSHPCVIRWPYAISQNQFIIQRTIAVGTTTLQLGGLVMITTGDVTADVPVAKDFKTAGIIPATTRNKKVLDDAGVTIAWGASFPASVKIDILILVPGAVIAMIHDAVAELDMMEKVRVAALGAIATMAAIATDADQRTQLGASLTLLVGTTGTRQRIAVLVGA